MATMANADSINPRVPQDISARWAFDLDELMPLDDEDLELLQTNTVVQIWLRRVQRRRKAEERFRAQSRKTRTTVAAAGLNRNFQRVQTAANLGNQSFASVGDELRERRKSLFSGTNIDDAEASVEALLAKPFNVREVEEFKPILASGEVCPKDLWVLSRSYWLETTLDIEEFSKWASMAVRQHQKIRKEAGIDGSNPLNIPKTSAEGRLGKLEEKRMARGSLPFAVPIPSGPSTQVQVTQPTHRVPSAPVQPRGPVQLPKRPALSGTVRAIQKVQSFVSDL